MDRHAQRAERDAGVSKEPERAKADAVRTGAKAEVEGRSARYIRMDGPVYDMPPETLLALAQQIGNSALLELMGGGAGAVATVSFTPPSRMGEGEVNRVTTAAPMLAQPLGLERGEGGFTSPFELGALRARADMGAGAASDGPGGMADGEV